VGLDLDKLLSLGRASGVDDADTLRLAPFFDLGFRDAWEERREKDQGGPDREGREING
jgi:hypothetical protein